MAVQVMDYRTPPCHCQQNQGLGSLYHGLHHSLYHAPSPGILKIPEWRT